MTLHWRRAPTTEPWALGSARAEATRTGLALQPGRMAVELRPPVHADKGTVVERLAAGFKVVAFVGDDVGDLPAFDVLAELAGRGTRVVRVAVADDESPRALAERADLVVRSTSEAVGLLEALARSIGAHPEPPRSGRPGDGAAR